VVRLHDIVNFNCDASCLSAEAWIGALRGGERSALFRWLRLYVDRARPVALGFTGASLADIAAYNPEAIALLRSAPEVFQILWRPFAHDLPFFRTEPGFCLNLDLGRAVAERLLGRISPIFLPPEFMQTNRQTRLLAERGAAASMIMASRFNGEIGPTLPTRPFRLRGIPDGALACIPARGELTKVYLSSLQLLDPDIWTGALAAIHTGVLWRDGESSFLLPDGIERERFWLDNSVADWSHLPVPEEGEIADTPLLGYPVHPFAAWMDEMSMLWFLQRVRALEQRVLEDRQPIGIARWLDCINSDILSAVEKRSPVISLRPLGGGAPGSFRIARSARGFEGEALLEAAEKGMAATGDEAWQMKARSRERMVHDLLR
jgi:hypothetical protein